MGIGFQMGKFCEILSHCEIWHVWPRQGWWSKIRVFSIPSVLVHMIWRLFIPNNNIHCTSYSWASSWENLLFCHMRTTKAQSDQCLCCLLPSIISLVSLCAISWLASLCSWADRFKSYLVVNPKNMFSHDETQIMSTDRDCFGGHKGGCSQTH